VKLAASIPVCFSAMRHNSELPAKATIASTVSRTMRAGEIESRPWTGRASAFLMGKLLQQPAGRLTFCPYANTK
jgi:hypothetical protein